MKRKGKAAVGGRVYQRSVCRYHEARYPTRPDIRDDASIVPYRLHLGSYRKYTSLRDVYKRQVQAAMNSGVITSPGASSGTPGGYAQTYSAEVRPTAVSYTHLPEPHRQRRREEGCRSCCPDPGKEPHRHHCDHRLERTDRCTDPVSYTHLWLVPTNKIAQTA